MADTTNTQAFYRAPTPRERFWRWAGFNYHPGDDPPDADLLPGWMRTTTGFNFTLGDRLRILLTGKLRISLIQHTDTPSPSVIKNRTDWHIIAPGAE